MSTKLPAARPLAAVSSRKQDFQLRIGKPGPGGSSGRISVAWISVGVVLAAAGAAVAGPGDREIMSLDGTWRFKVDPDETGAGANWAAPQVPFGDTIRVPGAWDAQGFGSETDKLHHNYVGKAWYKKAVRIPEDWSGRRLFLCVGGVHRYADVWVNGTHLGEHIGYLSPFEFEITAHAPAGSTAEIAIRVDSKQRWDVDALTGCFDLIDAMHIVWGGIWGHVWLEARPEVWIEDLFVRPRISPAGCTVTATLVGDKASCAAGKLEVLAADGQLAASNTLGLKEALDAGGRLRISTRIPRGQPWSPDSPYLYTARLSLLRGESVVDQVESRFGLREIDIRGYHFYLNGRKLFLRGYGDDAIYPETMAAPSEKNVYLKRLRVTRDYGFNFVRHHSHLLPPEYYDAADEVGMLVSAEFPIAYQHYYNRAKSAALELYETEWTAAIKRLRNHPSIFDWCMGNELYDSMPIASALYAIAKQLDPTRPVIDSDGLRAAGYLAGTEDRPTLDFYALQFAAHSLPLDRPAKHYVAGTPQKPVVCHETGNYATFPRLTAIRAFRHNFKPFWLTPVKAKLEKLGLIDEAEQWSVNSEKLYYLSHKLNTEDLRKSPKVSGYTWWLFQDYWTAANGLVDYHFVPKQIGADRVRQFNNDIVVLQNGLQVTHRGGRSFDLELAVSNHSADALRDATLSWRISLGDRLVQRNEQNVPEVEQGELVTIARAKVELPNVSLPQRATVAAELRAGDGTYRNDWATWVYPEKIKPPRLPVPLFVSPELARAFTRYRARAIPAEETLPGPAVYVVSQPNLGLVDAVQAGSCLICLSPQAVFPTAPNRFKPAWWLGSEKDCNAGTVVYDNPITRTVAPEGWCDAGWFRLLEGAQAYVLDDFPARPEVLVRGLDVHTQCRSKALLFQAKVGSGCLIVSGLNLLSDNDADTVEKEWLLDRLLEYAGTLPGPRVELPPAWLRRRIGEYPVPEGPFLAGFARLLKNEGEETTYLNYRGAGGPMYTCRQSAPGHLVEWQTETVPEGLQAASVTFTFAGGLGWRSQPETQGFSLLINGQAVLDFDLAFEYRVWRSENGKAALFFVPKKPSPQDQMGLFYVAVSTDLLEPGQPCRLGVRSKGSGSRRWFGLMP